MNSKKIINQNDGMSEQKLSKIAGIMFLLAFIIPTLNWALIVSKFSTDTDVSGMMNHLITNEILLRVSFTIELIMSIFLIVLAWALYSILKSINRNLALLALLLKLTEAAIAAVIVLISFIALQVINSETTSTIFTPEQLILPLQLILRAHTAIFSIPMVFLGVDMIIFCYLFYKSKYIPRKLAAFGILAFSLILVHALLYMIKPQFAEIEINQIIFWGPSGTFEIVIGIWLLVIGIRREPKVIMI